MAFDVSRFLGVLEFEMYFSSTNAFNIIPLCDSEVQQKKVKQEGGRKERRTRLRKDEDQRADK